METLFPDYHTYVGQDDVLFKNLQEVGEIYKIHGSCSSPNSLVLTSQDYDEFDAKNAYLAAKLLAIFVEHPVVFLGYSLSDRNVLSILGSIARCLTSRNITELQNRLVFVEYRPDSPRATLESVPLVIEGLTLPTTSARVGDFRQIFEALGSMKRRFPARLLRQLKEHVYELVKANDPQGRLYVRDIDEDQDLSGIEVVFGVGAMVEAAPTAAKAEVTAALGYRVISRSEIVEDILNDDKHYDPEQIVTNTLPQLLSGARHVPAFKYLRAGAYIAEDGSLIRAVPDRVAQFIPHRFQALRATPYRHREADLLARGVTFSELASSETAYHVMWQAALLPPDRIDWRDLQRFLQAHPEQMEIASGSQYFKVVCLLDLLRYGGSAAIAV